MKRVHPLVAGRSAARAAGVGAPVVALAFALVVAAAALAYVPLPERIHEAIAAPNKADGRNHAVRLELKLQIGERADVATAELVSHPTGLARLELRGAGGLIERHLLQAGSKVLPSGEVRVPVRPQQPLGGDGGGGKGKGLRI